MPAEENDITLRQLAVAGRLVASKTDQSDPFNCANIPSNSTDIVALLVASADNTTKHKAISTP